MQQRHYLLFNKDILLVEISVNDAPGQGVLHRLHSLAELLDDAQSHLPSTLVLECDFLK